MKRKISGEDILLAIGDLPEEYLVIPATVKFKLPLYKRLTIAASVLLFVGVLGAFLGNMGLFVPKMDMGADKNDAPESNLNGGSADTNDIVVYETLELSTDGDILNYYIGAENLLFTDEDGEVLIVFKNTDASTFVASININGTKEPITPQISADGSLVFTVAVTCDMEIVFQKTDAAPSFTLKLFKSGAFAEFEIIKHE